jgi:hypothetical protein
VDLPKSREIQLPDIKFVSVRSLTAV